MSTHIDQAYQPGTSVAVGTTSTPIVGHLGGRRELVISNDSDTVVYLRLAASGAAVGQGIRLAPGNTYNTVRYEGPVCAIHGGTGSKNLCVTEV